MRWLVRYRELRRLARENANLRQECEDLRRERDALSKESFDRERQMFREFTEREKLLIDRLLVVQAKTYPISDEATQKTTQTATDIDKAQKEAQNEYLSARLADYYADAAQAGVSPEEAYRDFQKDEPLLLDQFQRSLGFG